jgi:YjbE family integral membrane protein
VDFLLQDIMHAPFWLAALKIIFVNIILSGDNAVVIAMACLTLPPRQRVWGMVLGAGVAVLLRVIFTLIIAEAMTYPYLKLIGGALLFYVAIKLVTEDADGDGDNVEGAQTLWRAVRIVAIADIVMSLDNVLGMAGAAKGHFGMLFVGLVITMPLILFGSAMLMKLMERFPALITIGSGLLGYVAGDMAVGDLAVKDYVETHAQALDVVAPIVGALFVVIAGKMISRKKRRAPVEVEPAGSHPKQAAAS